MTPGPSFFPITSQKEYSTYKILKVSSPIIHEATAATQPTVKTVRPCHDSGRWRERAGSLQDCYVNYQSHREDLPEWHNSGKGLTERATVL